VLLGEMGPEAGAPALLGEMGLEASIGCPGHKPTAPSFRIESLLGIPEGFGGSTASAICTQVAATVLSLPPRFLLSGVSLVDNP